MTAELKNGNEVQFVKIFKNGDIQSADGKRIAAQEVSSATITEDDFDEHFETMPGGVEAGEDSGLYETYGDDIVFVKNIASQDPNRVWTMLDGDDDNVYISQGYSFVNRIAYILTENSVPWEVKPFMGGAFENTENNDQGVLFGNKDEEEITIKPIKIQ